MTFGKIIVRAAAVAIAASAASAQERVIIGTAGTAGALYPMGVAMAETINRHVEDITASAEATAASLANIRGLLTGDLTWGISSNEIAFQAYSGLGPYEDRPVESLQSLFGTVGSWVQIFAPADSEITSIADLGGMNVGVGAPGSGGEQTAQRLLAFYDLSYDDINEQFMEASEMADALQDGNLDAFIVTHPLRSAPLIDLTTNSDVKIIPVDDGEFYSEYPFFTQSVIPAGTYDNIPDEITTATTRIVMYTTSKTGLSEDQVYAMLAAIWDNREEWQGVHAAMRSVTLDRALEGATAVPLHPAAVRYFADRGLEVPSSN